MVSRVATIVVVGLSVLLWAASGTAQEQCRGTKQWYAGKCRYPKDIEELKKKAAAQKAEEARRQEEARRKAAEEAKKQADEKKRADEAACELARVANTVAGWRTYLKEHSGGVCLDEAIKRITELSGTPPPTPEPQPTDPPPPAPEPVAPPPTPVPEPVRPPPDRGEESSGVSPLVWVGFSVAGVGLVLGSITGGISFAEAQDLQDTCDNNVCPSSRQDDVDTMLALAHVSTVSFVLTGVGVTLGVIGLFVGGGSDEQARLDLEVGPGSLSLRGSF